MVVFPFRPNWRTPVVERLEWLTDIFTSHDGSESRNALRSAPRRVMAYELLLPDHRAARLDATLWRYQSERVVVPLWTDPQRLAAPLSAGAASIPAETAGYGFAAGGYAVLWADEGRCEAVEVAEVSAGLQLAGVTTAAWPAGTLLYPGFPGRFPADVDLRRVTAGLVTGQLQFELEGSPYPPSPSPTTYRGMEVATQRPNWIAGIPASYLRKVQRLDYQLGPVAVDDQAEMPFTLRTHRFTLGSRADIAVLRGWLHARAGMANAYWQPQWQMDMTQTAPIAASSPMLRVRPLGIAASYRDDPGRQDLALLHKSGQWRFRRVVTTVVAGGEEWLTLDSPLGIGAQPGDFRLITWLVPSRLAEDAVTLTWHTAGVVTTSIDIRSVRA